MAESKITRLNRLKAEAEALRGALGMPSGEEAPPSQPAQEELLTPFTKQRVPSVNTPVVPHEGSSLPQNIVETIPEVAGSILGEEAVRGALMGSRLPGGPVAKALGMMVGGGAGALFGRSITETLKGNQGSTTGEAATTAAAGASGVPVGRIVGKLTNPVGALFRSQAPKVIKGARSVAKLLGTKGVKLNPAQATDSALLDIIQNVIDASLSTAGGAARERNLQSVAGQEIVEEAVKRSQREETLPRLRREC